MPEYRLAAPAQRNLREIVRYTLRTWGEDQADRYLESLRKCMASLAASPNLGRACSYAHPDYRRYEHEKHVIFYRPTKYGIRVGRILHERMLPRLHIIGE